MPHTLSQTNTIIDIAPPIPRNISAANKDFKTIYKNDKFCVYLNKSIPIQEPEILVPIHNLKSL